MNYYQSKFTNRIIASNFARCLNYVYGNDTIDDMIERGELIVLDEPTLEECIRHGGGSVAVVRYMELNPDSNWDEASQEVRRIKKEIFKENRANYR